MNHHGCFGMRRLSIHVVAVIPFEGKDSIATHPGFCKNVGLHCSTNFCVSVVTADAFHKLFVQTEQKRSSCQVELVSTMQVKLVKSGVE